MTIACVSEYAGLKLMSTPNGIPAQCLEGPPIAVQFVDFSAGAAATTNPLNAKTKAVRINVLGICARKWGATPVASATTDERMSAEQTEVIGVPADHGSGVAGTGTVAYKLGFITRT